MNLRNFILNYVNVIYGITLFVFGIISAIVEVEPGVHDLTPFIVFAFVGFIFIFYVKPEEFRLPF